MVFVPAGEFTMGSIGGDEQPVHQVQLDAFWIDQTEVTNKLFLSFISETGYQTDAERLGSSFVFNGFNLSSGAYETASNGADWQHPTGPGSSITGKENFPVMNVSWNDAVVYCEWAGRRLPTEAEWEKAASGTDHYSYPWGNDEPNAKLGNFGNSVGHTTEVGHYPAGASPYGAYDMTGNVEEWVNDWYQIGYSVTSSDVVSNPQGPSTGDARVVRGGSWLSSGPYVRSAQRGELNPTRSSNYMGFRCALPLP
jgi:formylglycine-generating enzyme required for sulfatase activity